MKNTYHKKIEQSLVVQCTGNLRLAKVPLYGQVARLLRYPSWLFVINVNLGINSSLIFVTLYTKVTKCVM